MVLNRNIAGSLSLDEHVCKTTKIHSNSCKQTLFSRLAQTIIVGLIMGHLPPRLAQTIIVGLIMGLLFLQLEDNVVGVRSRAGVIFMIALTQFLFALLGTLNVFIAERPVFMRECLDRLYTPGQLYLSRVIVDVPIGQDVADTEKTLRIHTFFQTVFLLALLVVVTTTPTDNVCW